MKFRMNFPRLAFAGSLVVGLPTSAFAQVIAYGPAAEAVPTLSEWSMLILAVLLAASAVYLGRKPGNRLLSGLLVLAAIGVGGQGNPVGNVQATPAPTMVVSTGGTIDLSELGGAINNVEVIGHPTIRMQILSVTPASEPTVSQPTCTAGLIIAPGTSCYYTEPSGT